MCGGMMCDIDGILGEEFDKLIRDMRMHPTEYLLTDGERKDLSSINELEEQYKLEAKVK